jgi:hypothetical protein
MKTKINLEMLEKDILGFITLALVFFNIRIQKKELAKTRG